MPDEADKLNATDAAAGPLDVLVMWRPCDEVPNIKAGTMKAVVVARRSDTSKWHVFGAWYLNGYDLMDGDGEPVTMTGFFVESKHYDYDDWYEPIDVKQWQDMPAPPAT